MATFFRFSEVLKRYLETWINVFLRRLKEGRLRFFEFKKLEIEKKTKKKTDKRVHTTANFK